MIWSQEVRRWAWLALAGAWGDVLGHPVIQILAAYAKYYSGMLQ